MQIQLSINEKNADFFLQYLHSLKEGIIEKIVISDVPDTSFMVNSVEEVHRRLDQAEKRGEYTSHDDFWREFGVK